MTTDMGSVVWGDEIKLVGKVYDLDNNSPVVKVPPLWRILHGCESQDLELAPFDADGDVVR